MRKSTSIQRRQPPGKKIQQEKIQGKERLCVKPHTEKLKRKRNVTPKSVTRNRKCK